MVKSLYSGVTGLKTHQQRMDVIGNNIANVNTVGNKADVVTFSTVYFQTKRSPSAANATLGGVNPMQVGYGVKMNTTKANMTQSGYTQSDNKYDMAINGNGFFQVMDGAGNIYYTRAGVFDIDDAGYLVNADGYHVLGIAGDSTGQAAGSEIIRAVVPATEAHVSSATKRINGTDVTISVSAPSDHTDMTVTFKNAEYPYATYANDILTIFFNFDKQYTSEQQFEDAIAEAIQAGGITLPDDVSLQFDFAEIPSNPEAIVAENTMSGIEFSTPNSTAEVQYRYQRADGRGYDNAYMSFAIDNNISTDRVKVVYNTDDTKKGVPTAEYNNGLWTLTLDEDTEIGDLQDAIDTVLANQPTVDDLKVTFVCPDRAQRKAAIEAFAEQTAGTPAAADPDADPDAPAAATEGIQVQGTREGGALTGGYSVVMHDAGEFAENYKISFAYTQGYDKTKAVWDENNLTISICANTTIADVNKAIREAANGNTKKMMTFTDIQGLSDDPIRTITAVTTPGANEGDPATTTYTVVETDLYGMTRTVTGLADAEDTTIDAATGWVYVDADGRAVDDPTQFFTGVPEGDGATASGPNQVFGKDESEPGVLWTPGTREAFFGGNPAIRPAGGKDSFFTGVAKGLDTTFALADGRTGSEQSYKDFSDITIQQDGRIIGLHSVHGYIEIGRIDIALFDNTSGLAKVGGTNFQETVASGPAKLSVAGEGGAGVVLSGSLEMSNVDLADEFTNMITTQRGYQANSRVITVSDTMLEELLSLKR